MGKASGVHSGSLALPHGWSEPYLDHLASLKQLAVQTYYPRSICIEFSKVSKCMCVCVFCMVMYGFA